MFLTDHRAEHLIADACMQVGIMHTNYRELTRRNARFAGMALAAFNHMVNFLACSIHCHKASARSCHVVEPLIEAAGFRLDAILPQTCPPAVVD